MRHSFLSLSLVLLISVHAQWNTPAINTPVSDVSGVGGATPLSAPGPDGSTFVTWFENATGGYVLKMQRLDVDGVAMWAPGGIAVSSEDQNTALFRFDFKSDHAGNAIVAFQDMPSGDLDVVAYKISPDGEDLWPGGLSLFTPDATGIGPVIGVLSDDRVVFAWNTDRSPSTVAYLVVETDGSYSGDPLEIAGASNHGRPKVVPTSDGFWLQYVIQTGNFLSPGTMYAVRCDASGTPGPAIVIAANTISGFYFPEPISDGHDGLYVAFNSGNTINGNLTDVFVQRLRGNGITWSNTAVSVEDGVLTQRYTGTATPALVSDDDGLMMAYSLTNLNQSEGGIAVQKIDTAGTVQFGATGSVLIAISPALPQPFANAPVADGIVTAFTMGGSGDQTAHALHIDMNGAATPPAMIDLCTTASGKDDATLVPFRDGQAVAVWQDERNGGTIYAQPIEHDITNDISKNSDAGIFFFGGATPGLLFEHAARPSVLHITDANGRLMHEQRLAAQPEGARVLLPLDGMAAGVYLLSVEGKDGRMVQRIVH